MIGFLRRLGTRVILITPVVLLACPGCGDDKDDFEVIPLEGKVEKIELTTPETGRITVRYYSKKRQQETTGTGEVTRDTEILINGVVAKLADIREGERITGEVRVEKKGGEQRQIALKIIVDRPAPVGGG